MIRSIFSAWLLCWALAVSLLAQDSAPSGTGHETFRTTLEYQEGRYTSIFGLVPKEGKLELSEERVIVKETTAGNPSEFRLKLESSRVRRMLDVAGELPTIDVDPKPLTGKSVHFVQREGKWEWSVDGVGELAAAEAKEASRLVARFEPGRSPFAELSGEPGQERRLDLERFLVFLGYAAPREILGEATLGPGAAAGAGHPVTLQTLFKSGAESEELTIEIDAKGHLLDPETDGGFRSLVLAGHLTVAGHRDLPDGRRVPFNIMTEFKYSVERSVAPSP